MSAAPPRHAYVTLIAHGDGYAPGAEALGASLAGSGSTVPRVAMVTADVPERCRAALARAGFSLREVAPIANPHPAGDHLYPRFASVLTKLRAWELTEFDKVVFLDADTIVLHNIDDLFERPAFAAAPDFFVPDQFNSGAMVLAPSRETFAGMLEVLASTPSYDGGDQGFLNRFFSNWYTLPSAHRLPAEYNMHHFVYQFLVSHPSLYQHFADRVRIVHYTLQKPWQRRMMLSGGASLWWDRYYAAHPERDRRWRRRLHSLQDHIFGRIVHLLGA